MGAMVSRAQSARSGEDTGKCVWRAMGCMVLTACAMGGSASAGTLELTSPSAAENGYFGRAVTGIPDLDGDGLWDLAVGAGNESLADGYSGTGRVYVFSAADGGLLFRIGGNDPRIAGFGQAVTGVPDLDGGGYGEVLAGAPATSRAAPIIDIANAGQAFLFSSTGEPIYALQSATAVFNGRFGHAVAAIPDVDGDGFVELAIGAPGEGSCGGCGGAPGRVALFSGISGNLISEITSPSPQDGAEFGIALTGLPDVNGDGAGDLLIGQRGSGFVISGADGSMIHMFASPGLTAFGIAVASLPDADGDGLADYLVGAADGAALFSSEAGGLVTTFSSNNGGGEPSGAFLAGLSDMTGNGKGEVALGVPLEYAPPNTLGGAVYIYTFNAVSESWEELLKLESPNDQTNGRFGGAIAALPDQDSDGGGDLITGAWQDAPAPLPLGAGKAYRFTALIPDAVKPIAALDIAASTPTNLNAIPVDVIWSEPVTGFSLSDLVISPPEISAAAFTSDGDGVHFSFNIVVPDGFIGTAGIVVDIPEGAALDSAANLSALSTVAFEFDNEAPIPVLSYAGSSITSQSPIPVMLTDSLNGEPLYGIAAENLIVNNGSADNFAGGDGSTLITFDIVPASQGPLSIQLPAGILMDEAGNVASVEATLDLVYDNVAPSATLASASPLWINQSVFTVTLNASESVYGIDVDGFTVENGTLTNISGDDGDTEYICTIQADGEGPVTVNLLAGAMADAAGNQNTDGDAIIRTVDLTPPQAAVSGPGPVTASNPVQVMAEFDEPIASFSGARVQVTGGVFAGWNGGGTTFELLVAPEGDGPVTVELAAGVAEDQAGNESLASDAYEVVFDSTPPLIAEFIRSQASPTNREIVDYDIAFTEPVTGIDASDFLVEPNVGGAELLSVTGAGAEYTVSLATGTGEGLLGLVLVDDDSIRDAADLPLAGLGTDDFSAAEYLIDRTPPTVTIGPPPATLVGEGPLTYSITFSGEDLILLQAGHASLITTGGVDGSVSVTGTQPHQRTIQITGITGNGTIRLALASETALDGAGNSAVAVESAAIVTVVQDADGDGIPDLEEGDGDADGDGIPNYLDLDSDDDGMPDSYEYAVGLDRIADDAGQDPDGDGFTNLEEFQGEGHPFDPQIVPRLTIVSVAPQAALSLGGSRIVIHGVRLSGDCHVFVNGRPAGDITHNVTDKTLEIVAPPSVEGSGVIRVNRPDLGQFDEWSNGFRYTSNSFDPALDQTMGIGHSWKEGVLETFWGYVGTGQGLTLGNDTDAAIAVPPLNSPATAPAFVLVRKATTLDDLFGHGGFVLPPDYVSVTPALALVMLIESAGMPNVWGQTTAPPVSVTLAVLRGGMRPVDVGLQTLSVDSALNLFASSPLEVSIAESGIPLDGDTDTVTMDARNAAVVLGMRECLPGDVDCDGSINAIDVQFVVNAALGLVSGYETSFNGDDVTDAADIQFVINAALTQ